jgi:hypothetical protein
VNYPFIGTAPSAELSREVRRRVVAAIVSEAIIVLTLTASTQIFDSTFYTMANAVSLLSGDRIYRDFSNPACRRRATPAAAARR